MSFPFQPLRRGRARSHDPSGRQLSLFDLLCNDGAEPVVASALASEAGPAAVSMPVTASVLAAAPLSSFVVAAPVSLPVPLPPIAADIPTAAIPRRKDGAVVSRPSQPADGHAAGALASDVLPTDGVSADAPSDAAAPCAMAQRLLDFRRSPDLPRDAACEHAGTLGSWSEALVHARIISWGYDVSEPSPGAKYDLAIHVPPLVAGALASDQPGPRPHRRPRFVRLQIKATLGRPGAPRRFRLLQGYRNTGRGMRAYDERDFDLVAFVCLREEVVLFSSAYKGTHEFDAACVAMMAPWQREAFEAALFEIGAIDAEEHDLLSAPAWS